MKSPQLNKLQNAIQLVKNFFLIDKTQPLHLTLLFSPVKSWFSFRISLHHIFILLKKGVLIRHSGKKTESNLKVRFPPVIWNLAVAVLTKQMTSSFKSPPPTMAHLFYSFLSVKSQQIGPIRCVPDRTRFFLRFSHDGPVETSLVGKFSLRKWVPSCFGGEVACNIDFL